MSFITYNQYFFMSSFYVSNIQHSGLPCLYFILFFTFFFEIELNHLWQIRNEEQKFKSNKFPIFEMICNHPPLFNIQTDKNNISKFFFPFMFRTRIARLRSSGDISWDHHVTKSFVLHYRPHVIGSGLGGLHQTGLLRRWGLLLTRPVWWEGDAY